MRYLWGVLALVGCFLLPASARAATGGIAVSPAFQQITLAKGQDRQDATIQVTNQLATPVTIQLSENDFDTEGTNGQIAFLGSGAATVSYAYSLASWISLSTNSLTLAPGESQNVIVSILNKNSLSPGGHYGAIIGKLEDDQASGQNSPSVSLKQAFASLLFVTKSDGAKFSLDLSQLRLSSFQWGVPRSVDLRFHDGGNVHVTPRGIVEVIDPLGHTVATGIINEDSALLLPESFRVVNVPLRKLSPSWLPGKYTARVSYRYDGTDAVTVANISFAPTFLPYALFVGAILIFLAAVRLSHLHLKARKQVRKRHR